MTVQNGDSSGSSAEESQQSLQGRGKQFMLIFFWSTRWDIELYPIYFDRKRAYAFM